MANVEQTLNVRVQKFASKLVKDFVNAWMVAVKVNVDPMPFVSPMIIDQVVSVLKALVATHWINLVVVHQNKETLKLASPIQTVKVMKFAKTDIAPILVTQLLVVTMKFVDYKTRKLSVNVKKDTSGIQFHQTVRNQPFQIVQEIKNVKRVNHVKLMSWEC